MTEINAPRGGWLWGAFALTLSLILVPLGGWTVHGTASNSDEIKVLKAQLEGRDREEAQWRRRIEDKIDLLLRRKGEK